MSDLYTALYTRLQQSLKKCFGDEFKDVDPVLRPAQDARFGDFQANVAMSLAKQLHTLLSRRYRSFRALMLYLKIRIQNREVCQ